MDIGNNRQQVIQMVFIAAAALLLVKAFVLQVVNGEFKQQDKASGAVARYPIYPARGLIYDRKGKLLVVNNPMYDLMVTVDAMDTSINVKRFCSLVGITPEEYKKALDKDFRSGRFSRSVPFVFKSKISAEAFARFQEALPEFPGFEIVLRNAREYPAPVAAHLLGYIREVDGEEVKKQPEVYTPGDYIGASGLEKTYENELRGKKGIAYVLRDKLGRYAGAYRDGKDDIPVIPGKDIKTTVDLDLQQYAEYLLSNKRAGLVAIEPSTGEILAMVTTPNYDPNELTITNNARGDVYKKLVQDPNNPLFNRAVMAQYPPGSIHKTILALIGQQIGVWDVDRGVSCGGAYVAPGVRLGCHRHAHCGDLRTGIQHSCNAYFVTLFRTIVDMKGYKHPKPGLDTLNYYLNKFGYGRKLGVDYPGEQTGSFPTSDFFDRWYARDGQWKSIWIRSLGIGQGELQCTNIQLANLAAIIANRGHFYTPHFFKAFGDSSTTVSERFRTKHLVGVDPKYFDPVVDGMERVTIAGTARRAFIPDIPICGKTGTAENNSGEDHSIFFCFAPKKNPRIAIAVYAENAGFGGSVAAPVASLMIEKYLKGEIRSNARKEMEKMVLKKDYIIREVALKNGKTDRP
ncbi:MAG TPA: penicillin-binding protein 2 [Haliscomenobacter sp.]|uniref:penicillin-binding protein 2 n=1 Tax=Haliscomenobacter sp. TaxID=2717303 RepID=UPI002CE5A9D3|nr:penicillin-binding protein 2 [Haliscomenobacter sp.]HOY18355.1 penicillin-binding protein 2 [Haliscomenobacter sp.]